MSTNANELAVNEVGGSIPTKSKNLFSQDKGKITLNNNFQWTLDGIELAERSKIEIQIGGHWILGIVLKAGSDWFWSSYAESVVVDIMFGIKARRITNTSESQL
jgi:hypothetical protein